jgi:hypothetical protein
MRSALLVCCALCPLPQLLRSLLADAEARGCVLTCRDAEVSAALAEFRVQRAAAEGLRGGPGSLFAGLPWPVRCKPSCVRAE